MPDLNEHPKAFVLGGYRGQVAGVFTIHLNDEHPRLIGDDTGDDRDGAMRRCDVIEQTSDRLACGRQTHASGLV